MCKGYGERKGRFDVWAELVHFAEDFDKDWVPTGQLAEKLIAAGSNATGLLDRMVSENLIERRPSPVDRRSYEIAITETGRELLDRMDQSLTTWIGGMLNDLPVEELNGMTENFIKIRRSFLEDR